MAKQDAPTASALSPDMKKAMERGGGRVDSRQAILETAIRQMSQTVQRHETQLVEVDETVTRMDWQFQQQHGALEIAESRVAQV